MFGRELLQELGCLVSKVVFGEKKNSSFKNTRSITHHHLLYFYQKLIHQFSEYQPVC